MAFEFPDVPEQDWVIVENDIEWTIDEERIPWQEDSKLALPEGVNS